MYRPPNEGTTEVAWSNFPFGDGCSGCNGGGVSGQHFTGKERDAESGLDYFGARYNSSSMGRFMSPDFTGDGSDPFPVPSADFENPRSLNLYSYVHNNPLTNTDPDGHDCINTSNLDKDGTVTITAGTSCASDPAKYGTYVNGTVDPNSLTVNNHGDVGYSYSNYADGSGSAGGGVIGKADPYGPLEGPANQAGLQMLGAADKLVTNTTYVYAGVFGSVGAVIAGGEIAAGTAAARSGIIFRLAHGMRLAAGYSQVLAETGAVKNAIAAAIASGAIQKMGGSAFQGVVQVAGTFIRFTGAFTANGVVVSNVMGQALQK